MRYLAVLLLLFAAPAWGARNITFPFSEDFSDSNSLSDITYLTSGTGATLTRVQESWRGGSDYCIAILPPQTVGPSGINGEYAAIGSFDFSAQNTINVAFALYVGTTYNSTSSNCGGSFINKFIDVFGSENRAGLLGLNMRGSCTAHEFGMLDANTEIYWYSNGSGTGVTGDPNCHGTYFGTGSYGTDDLAGKWVWINYVVDHATGAVLVRQWDRDGTYSGTYIEIANGTDRQTISVNTIGGYFNECHPGADTNSRLLIDDLMIANSAASIDPPTGFLTGEEPPEEEAINFNQTGSLEFNQVTGTVNFNQ